MARTLVAGVDSSTQSCKVMIRDARTGALVRSGVARHAAGTEIDPEVWHRAFDAAVQQAGGLADVAAAAIAGQQHGLVALDAEGAVVRDAILWNDTRSAPDARDLVAELGAGDEACGRQAWADRVGNVPVASLTVSKLRWLARCEPEHLTRTAAVALPHDWLTWRLRGSQSLDDLATDRSEASGTGYFDAAANVYDRELLALAGGAAAASLILPRVLRPAEAAGHLRVGGHELLLGPGCGDNAGAALGLALPPGQVIMSLGTSGVVSLVAPDPVHDGTGAVNGFADASGRYLPLVCTLNAARVLDVFAGLLGVDHQEFSALALSAPPGAEGLVCIPYLQGERTPNLPQAAGALHGIRTQNLTPPNIARAAVEGMLCGVGEGVRALRRLHIQVNGITLIGGGARSEAVRRIAPSVLGLPVVVPEVGEYVADGAARQAAWTLGGEPEPPRWTPRMSSEFISEPQPFIQDRYQEGCGLVVGRPSPSTASAAPASLIRPSGSST
jgi:xylulokinase